MSGRYEKEHNIEQKIKKRIENLPSILNDYYYSLIGEGKSYDTTYRYINSVISFLEFTFKGEYEEDFYVNIKPADINKYIASLRTKDFKGKTERTSDSYRSTRWSALNSFFQFLVPDYISSNPVANTNKPKNKDNPQVTYLTEEEISKILKNVEKKSTLKLKNRDLCILKLGFSTGLRVSAITQINIDDVDFENNRIKITEKGDYDDYIMFGDNLKKQMIAWLEDRKKYFSNCDTDAFFVTMKNVRITDKAIFYMIKNYSNGITDKNVTPHVMRHSCATNLYEKTGDIYLCSRQLRHKNVTTTQRYAEISKEKEKIARDILDGLFK